MTVTDHRRICPVCGNGFYVPDLNSYAYKRVADGNTLYFCKWSHLREWDRAHGKDEKRSKRVYEWEQYHTCGDCKFYHDGGNKCERGVTLHPYYDRDACSAFRGINEKGIKASEKDAKEMWRLYHDEYWTQQAIADKFKVSRSYVVQILNRGND